MSLAGSIFGMLSLTTSAPISIASPRRVVDRVEGVGAALGVDRFAARVGPDDQRHPEAVAVLAHLAQLGEVLVLARRADVERVADRVGAEPHRVLDAGVAAREGLGGGGDVGLAVDLEDQRHLAGVVGVVLARHADLAGEGRVAGLGGEPELVVGVLGGRVGEEVARAVLDPLVDRQQHQGAVARSELEQQAAQAGPFAGRQLGQQRFLLGQALQLHALFLLEDGCSRSMPPAARPRRPRGAVILD